MKITTAGYSVLKGESKVSGKIETKTLFESKSITSINYDKKLFGILRTARKNIADKSGLPPYAIFSDKTLIEMSAHFPHTEEEMLSIHGVGEAKLKKYGRTFSRFIENYCNKFNIQPIKKNNFQKKTRPIKEIKKPRYEIIGNEFLSNKTTEEILSEYNFKLDTMLEHLWKYYHTISPINPKKLLKHINCSAETQSKVYKQFEMLGTQMLRPIYDAINEEISYIELKILRLNYLFQKQL